MKTPSALQIGDDVKLNFFAFGKIENCKIATVHFTEDKVRYDVLVPFLEHCEVSDGEIPRQVEYTLIKDVDSVCVAPMFEVEQNEEPYKTISEQEIKDYLSKPNTTMEVTKCETRTTWICMIGGHKYVRTLIDWNTDKDLSVSWHLSEDQKEGEAYLTEEYLEELFWLDKSNWKVWKEDVSQNENARPEATSENEGLEKSRLIITSPANHTLSEIFEQLKFGRPVEGQEYLDKCIAELSNPLETTYGDKQCYILTDRDNSGKIFVTLNSDLSKELSKTGNYLVELGTFVQKRP